jgi:dTDP-glucose 4,6-dehydratase
VHLAAEPRFTLVEADLAEGLPKHPALAGRFDAILHMASPASPTDFAKLPVEILKVGSVGTLALLDRAVADAARFLMASTSEAYGDPLVHPQPETYWGNVNPIGVRAVYDESKRFSEAATLGYHRFHGLSTAIVRIFNTYGPRMRPDDGRAIPTFISQALRGSPITVQGTGAQTRSITYVDDLVRGILLLLDSDETGPINVGTEHELTVLQLAELIVRLCGSNSPIELVERMADDPEKRRPDLTLARTLLGYEPQVGPEEGLRHTIDFFKG